MVKHKDAAHNKPMTVPVFLAWSGSNSKRIAEVFRNHLPALINSIEVFWSEDMPRGIRWHEMISKQLEKTKIGILCLTPDNLDSNWIHFEAGALAKATDRSYVCPFLLGVEKSDLRGPLALFQATAFNKEDVKKMIQTINRGCGEVETAFENRHIDNAFEFQWQVIEHELASILKDITESGCSKKTLRKQPI